MKIVIADSETTGLSNADRVVEWAHMECELTQQGALTQLVSTKEFDTLVNPGIPIPAGASNVHGIFDADVEGAPLITEILPRFMPSCSSMVVIGHNFAYDMKYVGPLMPPSALIGCSLKAARRYLPDQPKHSLDKLRVALSLPVDLAHSALGDVHTTFHLLNYILQLGMPWQELLDVMLAAPEPITRMPWGPHKGKLLSEIPPKDVDWIVNKANATSHELRAALQPYLPK